MASPTINRGAAKNQLGGGENRLNVLLHSDIKSNWFIGGIGPTPSTGGFIKQSVALQGI